MRRRVIYSVAAAAVGAVWLYGFNYFFDSPPGGLRLYTRAGLSAIVESCCVALYTPAAVIAAIMERSTGVFWTQNSTLVLVGCILQIWPCVLMFSSRLRHLARLRTFCDRWMLVCAALWVVGFIYIHFPTRHAMNKGYAALSHGQTTSNFDLALFAPARSSSTHRDEQGLTKRMQATARKLSVVSATSSARRRLI